MRNNRALGILVGACVAAMLMAVAVGCSKSKQKDGATPRAAKVMGGEGSDFCDEKLGPDDAKVKVHAYYPGRHPDALDAIRSLVTTFEGDVQVEIIDWRRSEGLERRDAAGLTCAGVVINGEYAFDLEADGQTTKVLFVRGIDGEWTKDDLEAAVRQALAAGGK